MSYRYACIKCELTSEPYSRRSSAEEVGAIHREQRHERMFPKGEKILIEKAQLPSREDVRMLAIGALILFALFIGSKFI